MSEVDAHLRRTREELGKALIEALLLGCPFEGLRAAMDWPLQGGGKMLRPALVAASARTVLEDWDQIWACCLPAAVGIELVHTYSLVHDDLPAMDDDAVRRGRPTVHVAFDEGVAVLAGDGLLTLAFEVASGEGPLGYPSSVPAELRLRVIALLARAAGAAGMVGGQSMDLGKEGPLDSVEALENLHRAKTGALFGYSMEVGALLAGAGPEVLSALGPIGAELGVAFQVMDDVLDAENGESGDEPSHVAVLGLEGARSRAALLGKGVLERLAELPVETDLLQGLVGRCVHRSV